MTFQSLSRWLLIPLLAIGLLLSFPHAKEYFHASISTTQQTTISPSEISLEASSKGIFTVQMKNFSGNPVKISLTADDASKVMIFPNKRTIKTNKKYLFFVFTDGEFNTDTTVRVKNESGEEMASVEVKKKVSTSSQPTQNPNCVDPGQGFWEVPSECLPAGHEKVTVIDGIQGSMYIPGGTSSDTFKDGEIYAVRHSFSGGSSSYSINISSAQRGEDSSIRPDLAFSRIPGNFTHTLDESGNMVAISETCKLNGASFAARLKERSLLTDGYCPLDAGKNHYWNIRVHGTPGCGPSGKWCMYQSLSSIPHHADIIAENPFPVEYTDSIPNPTPQNIIHMDGVYGAMYMKSADRRESMKDDEIYAVKYHFGNKLGNYSVRQLETSLPGEYLVKWDAALSRIAGSFDRTLDADGVNVPIPSPCSRTNSGTPSVNVKVRSLASSTECPLDPNQDYYWNMRVSSGRFGGINPGCGYDENGDGDYGDTVENGSIGDKWCVVSLYSTIPR